ncbi:MAG: RDD family protein [Endomicrobia bacterium]|nr:RDD family protein [Endomicrobiia bacterium]
MTAQSGSKQMIYIGFWKRAFALILDLAVIFIIAAAFSMLLQSGQTLPGLKSAALAALFPFAVIFLYFAACEASSLQATAGKFLTGIKVSDIEGRRLSAAKSALRSFIKTLLLLPFAAVMFSLAALPLKLHFLAAVSMVMGLLAAVIQIPAAASFLVCIGTKRKQNLYDLAAGSVVICKQIYDGPDAADAQAVTAFEFFKKERSSLHPALIVLTILIIATVPAVPIVELLKPVSSPSALNLPKPQRSEAAWKENYFEDIHLKINAPGNFEKKNAPQWMAYVLHENSNYAAAYFLKARNDAWTQSLNGWIKEKAASRGFNELEQKEETVTVSGLPGTKTIFTPAPGQQNDYSDFYAVLLVLNKNENESYVIIARSTAKVFAKNIVERIISSVEITN